MIVIEVSDEIAECILEHLEDSSDNNCYAGPMTPSNEYQAFVDILKSALRGKEID
jgi:hypothetical protein